MINVNGKEVAVCDFRYDWALALMSQGVIVDLSISRWRATAKLTPELLGLRFADKSGFDFMRKYINLGKQKLLPPETIREISHIENRARNVLSEHSFDTVWGRFVPFTAFSDWEESNNRTRDLFMEEARLLGNRYDEIIDAVRTEYKKMANDVWLRLYPDNKCEPTQSFISDFVDKIIAKIPSREDIVSSFSYEVEYFVIPMPSFIANDVAKAEEINRRIEMAEFDNELERTTKSRIAEEYARRKGELIDGFLKSTVMNMREHVSEICTTVLKSIGQTPSDTELKSQHINKIKDMIKRVKLLNFYDDKEIAKLTTELDTEINKIKGESKNDLIIDKLREIVEVTKKEFEPKYFSPAISTLEI